MHLVWFGARSRGPACDRSNAGCSQARTRSWQNAQNKLVAGVEADAEVRERDDGLYQHQGALPISKQIQYAILSSTATRAYWPIPSCPSTSAFAIWEFMVGLHEGRWRGRIERALQQLEVAAGLLKRRYKESLARV